MNDNIFRRDRAMVSVSPAALRQLQAGDASRAFAPEPPAARPLGHPVNVPASAAAGVGGDTSYAQCLVRVWGVTRAVQILRAEGRVASAELLESLAVRP